MIGYHALPGLPAVYHQVAALALVDAVRAYEFINVHVFHGSFLSHGRKAAEFFRERRQMEKSAAPEDLKHQCQAERGEQPVNSQHADHAQDARGLGILPRGQVNCADVLQDEIGIAGLELADNRIRGRSSRGRRGSSLPASPVYRRGSYTRR